MENPATWGEPERVIHDVHEQWHRGRDEGVVGWSLAKSVADALRKAGLLNEGGDMPDVTWEEYDELRDPERMRTVLGSVRTWAEEVLDRATIRGDRPNIDGARKILRILDDLEADDEKSG